MLWRIYVIILLLVCRVCMAQDFVPPEVTIAQLEEKFYPADSTVDAAIMHTVGKASISLKGIRWHLTTTITTRIKIYRKPGYDYADKEIRYFSADNYSCNIMKAATYNIEGGTIVKTPLGEQDVNTETLNEYMSIKRIHMPNVREGSIIEYTYQVVSPGISVLPTWYFQYGIPVVYSDYQVSIPTFFSYTRAMTGTIPINESSPKTVKEDLEVTHLRYTAKDVPAIKEEPLSGDIKNFIAAVWFEMSAVDYTKGEFVDRFGTDWLSMVKSLYEDEDFGGQLKETSYFRKDLKALLATVKDKTAEEKTEAIFNFVQQRMAWNGRENYYCSKGVKWAYENKTGNTADINLMLVAMLQYAGLEAYPIILSTRDNGVATYPNPYAYNYVVAALKINRNEVFMDATSKNTQVGLLPLRALNYKGRMLRSDGNSMEVDLMAAEKSKHVISVMANLDSLANVSGKVRENLFGYYGYAFREIYQTGHDSLYVSLLEKNAPGITVSNHGFKDITLNNRPVTEEYDFVHPQLAESMGDKLFISPTLFFDAEENPFTSEERLYPIDFVFPYQKKYMVSVKLPDNYTVVSLPPNLKLDLPDQVGAFNYSISLQANIVQFIMTIDINYSLLDTQYYKDLKDFFQKVIEKQGEKIVLKKG